jgi:two-component system NtrC family sensor kinase
MGKYTGRVLNADGDVGQRILVELGPERLRELFVFSLAVAAAPNLEQISAAALQQLVAVLPLVEVRLVICSGGVDPFRQRVCDAGGLGALKTVSAPAANSTIGRVLADGLPLIVEGSRSEDGIDTAPQRLCVALLGPEGIHGALELTARPGERLGDREVQFLIALAAPLGLAIEKALRYSAVVAWEAGYRALVEHANDAMLLLDGEGRRIIAANRSLERLSGYSSQALRAMEPGMLLSGAWRNLIAKWPVGSEHDAGAPNELETLLHAEGGVALPVSVGIRRAPQEGAALLLTVRDISGQQRTAQQIAQAEKLAAVGRLAASIAHEVNNPLQAIYNSLDLLIKHPLNDEKRQRYLDMARGEAERLIAVVQRMLDFSRSSREGMRPTHVPDLIDAALYDLQAQLEQSQVRLVRHWQTHLPRVFAIRSHLKQVFANLILNAIESMPAGGELTLRAYQAEADERSLLTIEFSDTGPGIPAHDLHKVFEPFYTTKPAGKGLGLAISYSIVQQHGGEMSAVSGQGLGTTFRLRLPAAE